MIRVRLVALCFAVMMMLTRVSGAWAIGDDPSLRKPIMDALVAELERTHTLKMEGFDPAYFTSFLYTTSTGWVLNARSGALFDDYELRNRSIYVESRVGDYHFDSSGNGGFQMDVAANTENRTFAGPIEPDADALRSQLWLAADQAYKNALTQYLGKKGKTVYSKTEKEKEGFDDFSREEPQVFESESLDIPFDRAEWADFARELTKRMNAVPEVVEGQVRVALEVETRYYVNTEGARIVETDGLFSFYARATGYADDGMQLQNHFQRYASSKAGLPAKDELRKAADRMVEDLVALCKAEVIDPISAPAILDAQTTGVFFHEAIGHRLEGERMRDTQEGQTFKGKVGAAILPSFIDVHDDPTMDRFAGEDLNGYYRFDTEGVPARRVTLIENGVLRNFLLSRAPIPGFGNSNGHGRGDGKLDPMGRMANLIVTSRKTVSPEALKKALMRETKRQGKPYGLILKNSRGGETMTGRVNFQAFMNVPTLIYKVDPDTGAETLVRGASLVGTPLVSISKILMTDDRPGVFNGFCGAESGFIPVSAAAPAALVGEIELQRTSSPPKRPPILPAPYGK